MAAIPAIPAGLYGIESPERGWNNDLNCATLEVAANQCHTEPCACGGAAWIRVWPEPQRGYAHLITYDSICPSCQWRPTTEDFWKHEEAAAAWNAARGMV